MTTQTRHTLTRILLSRRMITLPIGSDLRRRYEAAIAGEKACEQRWLDATNRSAAKEAAK